MQMIVTTPAENFEGLICIAFRQNECLQRKINFFFKTTSVFFTSESGKHITDEEQNSTCAGGRNGGLTVSIWRNLCGDDVNVLRSSPFYPSYPGKKNFIREWETKKMCGPGVTEQLIEK